TGIGAPFSATQNYTLHVVAPTVTVTPASLPAATAGTPYPTATFGASGGVAPYSYALNGTLPAGLSFNVGSGTVAGTPTETGNFAFVVTATDAHGFTGTANYTLAVASATLSLAPGSLPDATAEAAYSQVLTASGGVAPYAYTVANGALPAGLSLDSGTGTLSGTPTVSGNFSVGIKATDSSTGTGSPASITKTYTLAVAAPVITITPASLPAAQQAEVYSQALSASGGNGSYGYAVTSGALPAGLSLSGSGLLSGTPTVSGSFSFTVTATDGLHFTGAQAYTLAIGVAKPVAKDDTASTPANQAVTIAVTENDSGPIASIAVAKAPTHGTAAVSGLDVVYTPASNFFGTDTLTYTATGPGGTSAPATVTVTVTPLAVPTAAAQTATTLAGKAVTIHATQGASGGPFTAVAIASNPSSGTAAVSGQDIVYTPTIDASGPVSFTYTLSNPFGVSQPATVTVQVNPVPQVVAQTVDALAGTTVRVDLTRQARGGPFTGAALLSISPASAGTGSIVKDGDVYRLDFAAAATYAGAVQIRFTLSNAYATSAPGTITVNVTARPDPSKDAEVLGILGAQADATRRFALGQIDNFQRRLESLHGEGGTAGFSNGLSFISGSGSRHRAGDFAARGNDPFGDGLQRRYLVQPEAAQQDAQDASSAGRQPGDIAFWTGGAVNFGSQQVGGSSNGIDFTTSGISIGADKRLSPAFALGAGLGYGHDASDVGHKGSRSTADSYNVAAYASYRPSESTYLDGLVGYQWLSFDARRYVTANGNRVNGSRDGKQWFGSLSAGYEHRGEHLLLSPYGRLDMASATLDGYTEHGDAVYALHYDEQKVKTTTGSLGMRLNYPLKRDFGMLSPQLRVEYRHDFQGSSTAVMRYADLMSGPFYRATVDGQSRNHALLGLGLQMQTWRGLMFRVEYQNLFDNSSDHNQSIQLGLEAPFNP
ncbi:autotransporter domain-containing protein, partial [Frateuria sp. Soil773]|uniref:autotransporter domain-containing protein n=1 Tax=Frateuria sp. Soil773 TaxID=1736407 RepID=UPI00138F23C3